MIQKCLFLLSVILMTTLSCAINRLSEERTLIQLDKGGQAHRLFISVEKGADYTHKFTPGPFVIHVFPQMVFWLENEKGNLTETLYITGANGKKSGHSTKDKLQERFYEMSFPVWSAQAVDAGNSLPSKDNPYTDAVTTATPKSSFDLDIKMAELSEPFVLYAEINKSGDYNAHYTEVNSDWVGQPALIYAAQIDSISTDQVIPFQLIGKGVNVNGQPVIVDALEDIDTAQHIVREITVSFKTL